ANYELESYTRVKACGKYFVEKGEKKRKIYRRRSVDGTAGDCSPFSIISCFDEGIQPDKTNASFAQAGPAISYRMPEERMMTDRVVPHCPGRRRWPKAARPIETPACGMSAKPRYWVSGLDEWESTHPATAPRYLPMMRTKK